MSDFLCLFLKKLNIHESELLPFAFRLTCSYFKPLKNTQLAIDQCDTNKAIQSQRI